MIDTIVEVGEADPLKAEILALEQLKEEAVNSEDYQRAQQMKQRIEAAKRRPAALMKSKRAPPKKLTEEEGFSGKPWSSIIPTISAYKKIDESQLKANLENFRMALFDVDVYNHPKPELICLLVATVPSSNISLTLNALSKSLPEVNVRRIASDQLWILRESPMTARGLVRECRELLMGVRNFTELVSYNPNLLDTRSLKANMGYIQERAPGIPPHRWIERNLPPSPQAQTSSLLDNWMDGDSFGNAFQEMFTTPGSAGGRLKLVEQINDAVEKAREEERKQADSGGDFTF
ncbi:hypothetical protein AAMO2058_001103700 [Amorphochlora amoebiformis]